jgi:AcrR family transcriptional regulator
MPRKYDMSKRAAATEETRRRIVAATEELHNSKGIISTSWEDIADRAGVAVGTVYRHFPTYDELLPACGALSMQRLAIPSPEEAAERLAGARSRRERLRRAVSEVFGIYERGAAVIEAGRRDRDKLPLVDHVVGEIESEIARIVGQGLDGDRLPLALALTDLDTWRALRGQGITGEQAVETTTDLIVGWRARGRRTTR